jgi:ABC-type glutathione transport system ATPase component
MTPFLEVSSVSKQGEQGYTVSDITFAQKRFQKIVVAGETGSGKTTLLKLVAGLLQPDAGQVKFLGEPIYGLAETLVPGHPGIAYVSQHFELPKFLRVEQVLGYSNTLSDDDAATLFEVCDIAHLMTRKTDQLSGGERQRIALALRLISSPKLLLLDEPFSNLDFGHKRILKSIIEKIGARLKITCILVSHEPADTLPWADRIVVLREGKLVQTGTPEAVYRKPVNTYVAGLFGKYTILTPGTFNALFPACAVKTKRKHVLIRPEQFKLTQKSKKALKARVGTVSFMGGCYELEVFTSGVHLAVRVDGIEPPPEGTEVYITINPGDAWPLD